MPKLHHPSRYVSDRLLFTAFSSDAAFGWSARTFGALRGRQRRARTTARINNRPRYPVWANSHGVRLWSSSGRRWLPTSDCLVREKRSYQLYSILNLFIALCYFIICYKCYARKMTHRTSGTQSLVIKKNFFFFCMFLSFHGFNVYKNAVGSSRLYFTLKISEVLLGPDEKNGTKGETAWWISFCLDQELI